MEVNPPLRALYQADLDAQAYAHADKVWTDTIFRTPAGFRLVRIEC